MFPGALIPFIAGAAGIAIAAANRRRPRWMSVGIVLAFFAGGVLLWNARHLGPIGDELAFDAAGRTASTIYTIEGTVERPDILLPDGGYMQFTLRVDSALVKGATPLQSGGVLVRWSMPEFPLYSGDRVRIAGPLELDISRVNPGVGGVEDHYRRRGVHSAMRIRGTGTVEVLDRASSLSPTNWASRLRASLAARLTKALPEASRPFVLTVWLGDRRRISDETYTTFLESGTAHILAVSGIHLGIIFMTLKYSLRLFIPHRRARAYLIMGVVLLFALMAGARVSSMRAAIMIALYLAGEIFEREPDTPTALSLAAILFTLHRPDAVLDAGFQLSFLSIASILIFSDLLEQRLARMPYTIRKGLSTTLSVQILPLPVAVSLFHVIPFAGILLNLIVVPLLAVVLWLSFLTSAASFILPPAATLFGHALHPVVMSIMWLAEWVSTLGGAHRYLSAPTTIGMAAYAVTVGLLLAALNSSRKRARWLASFACSVVVTIGLWGPFRQEAEITFLDVGHGDAAFIRTPGGTTLLIDAGDNSGVQDMGKRVVGPFLWSNRVSRLDAVIISHPDRDHIGGAKYILEHFEVGTLFLGPIVSDTTEENALIDLCERKRIPVKRLLRGDTVGLAGAGLEVLHPPGNWPEALPVNESSLVLRLAWPGISVLFPGDAEALAEDALAQTNCTAQIVKVPHHGSKTSSSQSFIDAVQPDIAIVSVGRRGRRSVLSPDVIRRYEANGTAVLRTDIAGGIRMTTRDGRIVAETARGQRGYPMRIVD